MHPRPAGSSPAALGGVGRDWFVAVTVFATAFLLRWITLRFDNDYFMHLAWASQMLDGEWPVRDFAEPGFILQTLLAYVGFLVGGKQLIAEGVIVCGFIAAGAVCVYLGVRQCGGSRTLALAAAAIAVLAYPRSYAYPKAFLYPAAFLAIALHARTRSRHAVTLLALVTAIGFLFRHDHGLWIGGACGIALLVEHWRSRRALIAAVGRFVGLAAAIAAPWLAWVTFSGHAAESVDSLLSARSAVTSWHVPGVPVTIDRSAPLVRLAPVEYPRIAVRWSASLPAAERARKESDYGLQPERGSNLRYRLTDIAPANIQAILTDPAIEDTNDLDRSRQRLRGGGLIESWVRLQEYVPLVRVRIVPGIIQPANALALLAWLTYSIPWVVLALAASEALWSKTGSSNVPRWPRSVVFAMAFLGIVGYHGLVRGSPDSRLGDVASLTGVLIAYTTSVLWWVEGAARFVTRGIAVALVVSCVVIASLYGRAYGRLSEVELVTATELETRVRATAAAYARPPLDTYAGTGATGLDRIARWLHECTDAQSRVVVIGFEPQVFVLSERRFGAGLAFLYEGWNSSERNQRLALERWSQQRVPVVIAVDSALEEFSRDYPLLSKLMDEHYHVAQRSQFAGNKPLTVFVAAGAPARLHHSTGLPCWR